MVVKKLMTSASLQRLAKLIQPLLVRILDSLLKAIPLIQLAGPTGGGGRGNNVVVGTETHTMHDLDGSTVIQWVANMQNNMGHPAEFYASTSSTEPRGAPVVIQPGGSAAHIGYQDDYIQQLFLSIKWLSG
jgi:hypothetical protein